jgi:hypothetical protein
MFEFLSSLFAAPVFPSTILLGLLVIWSLVTIVIGGLDSHLAASLHLHFPFSGGHAAGDGLSHSIAHALEDAMGTMVLAPAKWLNLQQLPIVFWAGIFTLNWWAASILLWTTFDAAFFKESGSVVVFLLIARNIALGLLLTKLITQPMRGMFDTYELSSISLVGHEAEICSLDATPESGQVKYKTDGAPLLLNVRTDGPHLPKGTRVWLTHYDKQKRIYIVSATTTTSNSTSTGIHS